MPTGSVYPGLIISLLACGALIILFLIKKYESRFLYWFGFYSYEIYLLHWPILSRFDLFYRFAPAWLATVLYLAFFIASAWVMQWLIGQGPFLLSQFLKRILKRKPLRYLISTLETLIDKLGWSPETQTQV